MFSGQGWGCTHSLTHPTLRSVTQWFDEEGVLVFDKFHADFSRMCKDAEKSGKNQ